MEFDFGPFNFRNHFPLDYQNHLCLAIELVSTVVFADKITSGNGATTRQPHCLGPLLPCTPTTTLSRPIASFAGKAEPAAPKRAPQLSHPWLPTPLLYLLPCTLRPPPSAARRPAYAAPRLA